MATLQELTLAHSRRLSGIYRTRDVRLAEAQATRDGQLRGLAAAAKAFQKYDDELASAREKQLATDAKAEAARTSDLLTAVDRRADRLEDAQLARRAADTEAVRVRRRMEDAAEAKYLAALTRARDGAEARRAEAIQDADRTRRHEFDQAKQAHDTALAAAQQQYRLAVDEAVIAERREGRDIERGYFEALRLGEAAARAARAAADQNVLLALTGVEESRAILRAWRAQLASIAVETAKAEKDEFSRFRRELETVKT